LSTSDFPVRQSDRAPPACGLASRVSAGCLRSLKGQRPAGVNSQPARAIAAIYTGSDAKTPVEILFDLGIGDAYVVRVPGVLYSPRTAAGLEYAAAVGGVKAIVVMDRADSELLAFATEVCNQTDRSQPAVQDCTHLDLVLQELFPAMDPAAAARMVAASPVEQQAYILSLGQTIICRTIRGMLQQSATLSRLVSAGQLKIVGAIVDSRRGQATFFDVDSRADEV